MLMITPISYQRVNSVRPQNRTNQNARNSVSFGMELKNPKKVVGAIDQLLTKTAEAAWIKAKNLRDQEFERICKGMLKRENVKVFPSNNGEDSITGKIWSYVHFGFPVKGKNRDFMIHKEDIDWEPNLTCLPDFAKEIMPDCTLESLNRKIRYYRLSISGSANDYWVKDYKVGNDGKIYVEVANNKLGRLSKGRKDNKKSDDSFWRWIKRDMFTQHKEDPNGNIIGDVTKRLTIKKELGDPKAVKTVEINYRNGKKESFASKTTIDGLTIEEIKKEQIIRSKGRTKKA